MRYLYFYSSTAFEVQTETKYKFRLINQMLPILISMLTKALLLYPLPRVNPLFSWNTQRNSNGTKWCECRMKTACPKAAAGASGAEAGGVRSTADAESGTNAAPAEAAGSAGEGVGPELLGLRPAEGLLQWRLLRQTQDLLDRSDEQSGFMGPGRLEGTVGQPEFGVSGSGRSDSSGEWPGLRGPYRSGQDS